MATEVKLPRLGQGMESGTIVRWLKAEGDSVKKREPLYELDTDKVTQEVESDLDGILLKIVVQEGEVEVGSTIAMIENGSAAEAAEPESAAATAAEPAAAEAPDTTAAADAPPTPPDTAIAPAAKAGAAGSRHPRSPAGSRASAASTWLRSPARDRMGASWPTTSRTPRSEARRRPPARRRRHPRATSRS